MKENEAKKVIEIIKCADGGCEFCVGSLKRLFKKQFPNFAYLLKENNLNK
jgi:hypothetical protein